MMHSLLVLIWASSGGAGRCCWMINSSSRRGVRPYHEGTPPVAVYVECHQEEQAHRETWPGWSGAAPELQCPLGRISGLRFVFVHFCFSSELFFSGNFFQTFFDLNTVNFSSFLSKKSVINVTSLGRRRHCFAVVFHPQRHATLFFSGRVVFPPAPLASIYGPH